MDDEIVGNVLDPMRKIYRSDHDLPHWMQDGVITFVTMRLADSLPRGVLEQWERERLEYLGSLHVQCRNWREGRDRLSPSDRRRFDKVFLRRRELELDKCHGSCRLRDARAAKIVADSLLHFDDDRYLLGDFVIMPNHVHLLVAFPQAQKLRKQCYSWMHYTAVHVNRLFGISGTLWQEEPFDHLVRNERQLLYLRSYIESNPPKARLKAGEFFYQKSNRHF